MLQDCNLRASALQKRLDEATAINQQLAVKLEKLGKDAEQMQKSQAAAEARLKTYHQVMDKLHAMIDAGDLTVVLRNGRMVIRLPNDVLFDSGKKEIKAKGTGSLKQIATVMKDLEDRRFEVEGHTDTAPIKKSGFATNWELSTARAVEVVKFLVKQGVAPTSLSAAGYGEFDPVASNEDKEGKAQNRRIDIVLQPNLDEIAPVPEESKENK